MYSVTFGSEGTSHEALGSTRMTRRNFLQAKSALPCLGRWARPGHSIRPQSWGFGGSPSLLPLLLSRGSSMSPRNPRKWTFPLAVPGGSVQGQHTCTGLSGAPFHSTQGGQPSPSSTRSRHSPGHSSQAQLCRERVFCQCVALPGLSPKGRNCVPVSSTCGTMAPRRRPGSSKGLPCG